MVALVVFTVAVIVVIVRGEDGTLPDVTAPTATPTTGTSDVAGSPTPAAQPTGPTPTPAAPTTQPSPAPTDSGTPDAEDQSDREPDPAAGGEMPNTGGGAVVPGLLLVLAAARQSTTRRAALR
jgi:hypothetical protein